MMDRLPPYPLEKACSFFKNIAKNDKYESGHILASGNAAEATELTNR